MPCRHLNALSAALQEVADVLHRLTLSVKETRLGEHCQAIELDFMNDYHTSLFDISKPLHLLIIGTLSYPICARFCTMITDVAKISSSA